MIKSVRGQVEIKGSEIELISDLTILLQAMLDAGVNKKLLQKGVETGMLSRDELNARIQAKAERVDELMRLLFEEDED